MCVSLDGCRITGRRNSLMSLYQRWGTAVFLYRFRHGRICWNRLILKSYCFVGTDQSCSTTWAKQFTSHQNFTICVRLQMIGFFKLNLVKIHSDKQLAPQFVFRFKISISLKMLLSCPLWDVVSFYVNTKLHVWVNVHFLSFQFGFVVPCKSLSNSSNFLFFMLNKLYFMAFTW